MEHSQKEMVEIIEALEYLLKNKQWALEYCFNTNDILKEYEYEVE